MAEREVADGTANETDINGRVRHFRRHKHH